MGQQKGLPGDGEYESLEKVLQNEKTLGYGSYAYKNSKTKLYLSVDGMLSMVGGFGCFQWLLDAIFCIMMFPASYQVLIMYFAAMPPSWRCLRNNTICVANVTYPSTDMTRCVIPKSDWTYTQPKGLSIVTTFDLDCDRQWLSGLTTSVFFLGWAVGSMVLGVFADKCGRKAVIFPALTLLLIGGLISPFFTNIWVFLCSRFVTGFVSPIGIQMFILMLEYVDSDHRALAGNLIFISGSVGLCLLGVMAYYVPDWKMLFVICTAPYFLLLLFIRFVPESVRWLNLQGRTDEINKIFLRISKWNRTRLPYNAALEPPQSPPVVRKSSNPMKLFKTREVTLKTAILAFNSFTLTMIFYGLSMCSDNLGGNIYRNFVLISAVEIPATIFAIGCMDKFGRKRMTLITMLCGSVACICIVFVPEHGVFKVLRLVIGMTGKLCLTSSLRIVVTWSVEIFPTVMRAEGIGFLQIASRIGAACSPYVSTSLGVYSTSAPFLVMGGMAVVGALLVLLLPETQGKQLLEVAEAYEEIKETNTSLKKRLCCLS